MFRRQQRKIKLLAGLADAVLTCVAFVFAYRIRQSLPLSLQFYLTTEVKTPLLVFCAILWSALGYWFDVYGRLEAPRFRIILRDSARQAGSGALALVVFLFATKLDISRVFLTVFVLGSWLLLVLFRRGARDLIALAARKMGFHRNILIFGVTEQARTLARRLEEYAAHGVSILGFIDIAEGPEAVTEVHLRRHYPVFSANDLQTMLARQLVIDEILFAVDASALPGLDSVFRWCEEEGVCTRVAVDFLPVRSSYFELEEFGDVPLLTFSGAPTGDMLLLLKRGIDVVLSLAALIVLSPFLLAVAAAIWLTSGGPVIFRQSRCGLNGRMFTCYKFRSMVPDAEARLAEVIHLNTKQIAMKIPNDPRLAPLGKWLRKFSIDELPQLVNVLRGDMSLVGPRPAIPSEVAQYKNWQRRRLRMRPGLTCLWAIQGRDHVDFESWMRLDLQYIDNWSLGLDARIILMTIPSVLTGRGAG